MQKKWMIFIILLIVCIALGIFYYKNTQHIKILPTYFHYNADEKASLSSLNSKQIMTEGSLNKWDTLMFDLIKTNKLGDAPASRVYAYLYVAQRDAAFLSYSVKQRFMGNLDVVSAEVLCLFFANDCPRIKLQIKMDDYSSQLAKLILTKIKQRIEADQSQIKWSNQLKGSGYWLGVNPFFGQDVGSWKPWVITSANQFLPQKPLAPTPEAWQEQLKKTETALKNITPKQTKLVVFWAGNPSTITPPGIWLKFANDYMDTKQVSFPKVLFVRSVLAMGIADVIIAVFDAKYTYWIKRPFMLNPNLHTIMPTPNHPSYPAAHSSISAAAATILSYYFPNNKAEWWVRADEASMSRIWGGIHFSLDAQAGLTLGQKVGEAVIKAQPSFNME